MSQHKYDRHYCAIITPFQADSLDIDYDAFRKHIRYYTQDEGFVRHKGSFIVNPEAAEMFYFSKEERQNMIKIMLEEKNEDMPIFAGVFGVTVDDAIECALEAKEMGCDGLFIFPPAGTVEVTTGIDNVKCPETWRDWVKMIDDEAGMPIILHPAAPPTMEWGTSLPIETVKLMVESIPNIVGYKMIYGSESAHFRIARYFRSVEDTHHVGILNWSNYALATCVMCDLVDGTVQGAWNWLKEPLLKFFDAYEAGNLQVASETIKNQISPLWEYIYQGGTRIHIRYKIAVWLRGFISHPFMRPPMPPPRKEEVETLFNIINNAGLSCIDRKTIDAVMPKQDMILATGLHRK